MKKQVKKISLKTDKIVNLSNAQAMNVQGGKPRETAASCQNANTLYTCPGY
jgi:hypothetical protein